MARLRGREEYNVVLITLDTTRADRLGCYGFADIDTPTIDRFAREGIRFERCFAQTPLTLPSHTTIMTGTYPPLSRRPRQWRFSSSPRGSRPWPSPSRNGTTRPPRSSPRMFWTRKWGLNQGFDYYFDKFDLSRFETISLGTVQRPANEVMDEALSWLEKAKGASSSPGSIFTIRTRLTSPLRRSTRNTAIPTWARSPSPTPTGPLWDFLETNKLRDKTLIVFCADHGESLGAHQEGSHGFFIYQETLHVPLIVVTPFNRIKNVVSPQVVTLADVMPRSWI